MSHSFSPQLSLINEWTKIYKTVQYIDDSYDTLPVCIFIHINISYIFTNLKKMKLIIFIEV